MEYKVIEDTDLHDVEKDVEKHMREGWVPQGGIAVCMLYESHFAYFQAMTRKA